VVREGRGARVISRLWLVAALGCAPAALAPTAQVPPPPVPAAVEGTRRTVRYELERTLGLEGGGDGKVLSSRGCSWIVFQERVARVVGDREVEIEIEVLDGDHARCQEGRRFTLKTPFADPVPNFSQPWQSILGPVELARILHARLGQANGTFSFGFRELPWNGTTGSVRSGGVDYVTYAMHDIRADKGPTPSEMTSEARMQLRRRDGRFACARHAERLREVDAGAAATEIITREAIIVDYGDGAPPRCEDAAPGVAQTTSAAEHGPAAPPILSRVQELQAAAHDSARGYMGCGVGTFTLITSRGRVRIETGLDPSNVFGKSVAVSDLLALLEARIASNNSGTPGPMSGDVGHLGALSLGLLSAAKEPKTLEVSAALLTDPDVQIRREAAITLYELGDRSPRLRPEIRKLHFPKQAVQEAASTGRKPPAWLE
jgi:hypothetical protein